MPEEGSGAEAAAQSCGQDAGRGDTDPEELGEQLALLLDGASARARALDTEALPTAAAIAAILRDNHLPSEPGGAGESDN